MILSRTPITSISTIPSDLAGASGGIVQCTGSIFEGEGGQRYAKLVEGLVSGATRGVADCDEGVSHLLPLYTISRRVSAEWKTDD